MKTKTVFEISVGRIFPIEAFDDDRMERFVGVWAGRAYRHAIFLEPKFAELVDQGNVQRNADARGKRKKRANVLK